MNPYIHVIHDKFELIKTERDRRTQTGGYYVSSVGKWFHSDNLSRIQQIGLLLLGANIPAGLQWKTMDGTFITMTQSLAAQVFQAAATSDSTIFAYSSILYSNLQNAGNPVIFDVYAGWPKIFGE